MADTAGATLHFKARWLKKSDFLSVTNLDREIFDHPWKRSTMDEVIQCRNNLCIVVEHEGAIVGFSIFDIHRDRFYILKIGVSRPFRRLGIGTELMNFLKSNLNEVRNKIEMDVREGLAFEGGVKFFKTHDLVSSCVNRDFFKVFDDGDQEPSHVEDSINFLMSPRLAAVSQLEAAA